MIEYYQNCFHEKANEKLSELLFQESPIKVKTEMIEKHSTMEILKKTPQIFLFQAGYLTFANYENIENVLKITNNEVRSTLTTSILESLNLRSVIVEQFEEFLNQTIEFFDLHESKSKEALDAKFNEIRTSFEKILVDTMNEAREKSGKIINEKTPEKQLINLFFRFLNTLDWKKWALAYQGEIFISPDEVKKPDFIFYNPKEETEIIFEFMKSKWNDHNRRNYQEKIKMSTKRIVVIYYMFKNFDKVERFGLGCYRREKEKVKLVFERI